VEIKNMSDAVALHYMESGQGMPVVLLHGFPLSGSIWHTQRERLSERYRVVVPDLRGHGRSPAPAGIYEMDLLARDVFALLDALAIEQAVIMGHSMGGYATLAAWQLAPERFLGLGLIASQAAADTEEARQNRYKLADNVGAEGSQALADGMLPKLFAPNLAGDAPCRGLVRQLILATQLNGIIGSLKGMALRPDSGPLLPTVSVPTLIVAGRQDQIIAPAKAEAMARLMPHATLAMIDNAGHMPMLEQFDATTSAMQDFLAGIDSAG
jgi:3-oxoadipate enol-lactonase